MKRPCVMAFDVGTTGAKTCIYRIGDSSIEPLASATAEYGLDFLPGGGAEQEPEDWWKALVSGSRTTLAQAGIPAAEVRGVAFCSQMQGLVLVDAEGRPVRKAMSYLDYRASDERDRLLGAGFRIAGLRARHLLPSLLVAGGVSASAKDPVWKYRWVRRNEPELFERVSKWLDVKDWLVLRATGRACMTKDSAHVTFLYDTRPGRTGWSPLLCRLFDVELGHLPDVIDATDKAGGLLPAAADDLGLAVGTPVFGGGGDLSLIALGAGTAKPTETHLYMGTSGWVSTVTDRRLVDTSAFIASILAPRKGRYNYISEMETAGKCMEWFRDHLALDEIGVYLDGTKGAEDPKSRVGSLYDLLSRTIAKVEPGSGGTLFAPWLHGSRSPFEDSSARGIFFNICVGTGKAALLRSVVEGLAFQFRWQLEALRRKAEAKGPLRFVGGGARSPEIAAVFADVLGEPVQTTERPQDAGALGAAIVAAAGLGLADLDDVGRFARPRECHEPRVEYRSLYDRQFAVFKELYRRNAAGFAALNE